MHGVCAALISLFLCNVYYWGRTIRNLLAHWFGNMKHTRHILYKRHIMNEFKITSPNLKKVWSLNIKSLFEKWLKMLQWKKNDWNFFSFYVENHIFTTALRISKQRRGCSSDCSSIPTKTKQVTLAMHWCVGERTRKSKAMAPHEGAKKMTNSN